MSANTKIEWTDATWTPIRARARAAGKVGWHCEHVSEGCRNCYAEGMNRRLGTGIGYKPGSRDKVEIFLDEKMLLAPLRWKKPKLIFVCSTTDLFADFVPDGWIDRVFAVMALCPQHTFQVLTKRSKRMREYLSGCKIYQRICRTMVDILVTSDLPRLSKPVTDENHAWPLPNLWLGVSVEDQRRADERIPDLLATPAAVRFISAEPLLGPITLRGWETYDHGCAGEPGENIPRIDQAIVGGESGPGARPMHPDWVRSIRDQCQAAGTAFFFKQWGEWSPIGVEEAHEKGGECLFWQGEELVHWPLVETPSAIGARRVGKSRAGRHLDGRTWDEFPEARG